MIDTEQLSKQYDQLNSDEKVAAILGAIFEPMTKEQVIKYSGIKYDGLGDLDKSKVDAVFKEAELPGNGNPDEEKRYKSADLDAERVRMGEARITTYLKSLIRRPNL